MRLSRSRGSFRCPSESRVLLALAAFTRRFHSPLSLSCPVSGAAGTPTLNWSRLPYILCTAAAPHPSLKSSVGLQLAQIAAAGNAAQKALLADVTEKNPDASYVELLRLFKVRRSVADRHS